MATGDAQKLGGKQRPARHADAFAQIDAARDAFFSQTHPHPPDAGRGSGESGNRRRLEQLAAHVRRFDDERQDYPPAVGNRVGQVGVGRALGSGL